MNTLELLDRVKREYKLTSDYQLSKILDISRQRVSNYRNSKRSADDDLVFKCEKLLKAPPGSLLIEFQANRTKCPQAAKILHKISAQIARSAAALLLVFIGLSAPFPSQSDNLSHGDYVYYVKYAIPYLIPPIIVYFFIKIGFFTYFKKERYKYAFQLNEKSRFLLELHAELG